MGQHTLPHACDECGKRLTSIGVLTRYIGFQHPERATTFDFPTEDCSHQCFSMSDLALQLHKHQYIFCEICKMHFTRIAVQNHKHVYRWCEECKQTRHEIIKSFDFHVQICRDGADMPKDGGWCDVCDTMFAQLELQYNEPYTQFARIAASSAES